MNKVRRAWKKVHTRKRHNHQNRAARTDKDGKVTPCPACRPGRKEG